MTAQVHEILILDGRKTSMTCCPSLPAKEPRIVSSIHWERNTSCWRGYVGTWEIKDGRLFLVDLSGSYVLTGWEPIFADWFSGEITVPEGELLKYVHAGFASVYERVQHLQIEAGVVVKTFTVANQPKAPPSAPMSKDGLEQKTGLFPWLRAALRRLFGL